MHYDQQNLARPKLSDVLRWMAVATALPATCVRSEPAGPPFRPPHGLRFDLTAVRGALQTSVAVGDLSNSLIFEQDPVQILDALLPLYLSGTLLRSLQVGPGITASKSMLHCIQALRLASAVISHWTCTVLALLNLWEQLCISAECMGVSICMLCCAGSTCL